MKLINVDYPGLEIKFVENMVNVLVCESRRLYSELIYDMVDQCAGHSGGFVLSEDARPLNPKNSVELIIDPFHLDFANRRIVSKLHQEIADIIHQEMFEKLSELNAKAIGLIDEAVMSVPYPIAYDVNADIAAVLKQYNVRIDDCSENMAERLCIYMEIMNKLCGIKLFAIANLGTFVDDEELALIYKTAAYEKIHILLLENRERKWLNQEEVVIIDKDRCLIKAR